MLQKSLKAALRFLTESAIIRDNTPPGEHSKEFKYANWNGALRGEYALAAGKWDTFCPIWHTGQAIKALCLASQALHDRSLLEYAKECAAFLLANQLLQGEDEGLLLAFEDDSQMVNTSAILESLDGLFMLSDAIGDPQYEHAALNAAAWVARKAWLPETGKFQDTYDIRKKCFTVLADLPNASRPLLDDCIFYRCYQRSGNAAYRDIALAAAETLLRDEGPEGNWIKYHPCIKATGSIHPRHAFWWGKPMAELFHHTGDERYREIFFRSVTWYEKAIRHDGGLFRGTYPDFSTDSFGHATSGSACAALCFMERAKFGDADHFMALAGKCLDFCTAMQLTSPADPALTGVIIEKVMPPDGSGNNPYYIRDLGTVFFVQAAAVYMMQTNNKL